MSGKDGSEDTTCRRLEKTLVMIFKVKKCAFVLWLPLVDTYSSEPGFKPRNLEQELKRPSFFNTFIW
jgi:hypothetical protein